MIDYKVRESYRNRGLKCFKVSFLDFLENLGVGFEDRGYENGKKLVTFGYYYGEDIKIRILHSGKILHSVYVKYQGLNPEKDLKQLRDYFEEVGLKRVTFKTAKLEKKANAA